MGTRIFLFILFLDCTVYNPPIRRKLRENYAGAEVIPWLTGRQTRNVAPDPGVLSTETRPPWASTIFFTIESPSPVPPASRERSL